MQVMFGGTNVNKDVAALTRGPPNILVRWLLLPGSFKDSDVMPY